MTIGQPDKLLTAGDIPLNVRGAAAYGVQKCATGGCDVFMIEPDGHRSIIGHSPSEQGALRMALRYQKKENASAIAEAKKGRL